MWSDAAVKSSAAHSQACRTKRKAGEGRHTSDVCYRCLRTKALPLREPLPCSPSAETALTYVWHVTIHVPLTSMGCRRRGRGGEG